jgi:hypothetical protein
MRNSYRYMVAQSKGLWQQVFSIIKTLRKPWWGAAG